MYASLRSDAIWDVTNSRERLLVVVLQLGCLLLPEVERCGRIRGCTGRRDIRGPSVHDRPGDGGAGDVTSSETYPGWPVGGSWPLPGGALPAVPEGRRSRARCAGTAT